MVEEANPTENATPVVVAGAVEPEVSTGPKVLTVESKPIKSIT